MKKLESQDVPLLQRRRCLRRHGVLDMSADRLRGPSIQSLDREQPNTNIKFSEIYSGRPKFSGAYLHTSAEVVNGREAHRTATGLARVGSARRCRFGGNFPALASTS